MPCSTSEGMGDYCNHPSQPTKREIEYERVTDLLYILGLEAIGSLDKITEKLCDECKKLTIKEHSPELQIWWRDHKAWDELREATND